MYMYDDTEFLLQGEGVREIERFTLLSAGVRALHLASAFVIRLCQAGPLSRICLYIEERLRLTAAVAHTGRVFLYTRYLCCLLGSIR